MTTPAEAGRGEGMGVRLEIDGWEVEVTDWTLPPGLEVPDVRTAYLGGGLVPFTVSLDGGRWDDLLAYALQTLVHDARWSAMYWCAESASSWAAYMEAAQRADYAEAAVRLRDAVRYTAAAAMAEPIASLVAFLLWCEGTK